MGLGQCDKVLVGLQDSLKSLLGSLESLIAEVESAAVMGLENKEPDSHRGICLVELRVVAGEKLRQGDEVPQGLAHLLSVDRYHVVVDPVTDAFGSPPCHILSDLALMVGEHKVHSSSVNIELLAKIFLSHDGAFQMPSGETLAPWARPVHYVLRLGLFPKGEIEGCPFVALSVKRPCAFESVIQVASGKNAVMVFLGIFLNVEIDGTI